MILRSALPTQQPPPARRALKPTLVIAASSIAFGLSTASEASAKTVLWTSATVAEDAPVPSTPDRVYDVDGPDLMAGCMRKGTPGTPLVIGWSGLRAPAFLVNPRIGARGGYVQIETRYAMSASRPRARVTCASGALRPALVRSKSATVNCGTKLALGLPASNTWPYIETPVVSRPEGKHRWRSEAGPQSTAAALCVSARAFKRVTRVTTVSKFRVGSVTTTLEANCPGGRRPIAWGHEAQPIVANLWQSVESPNTRLSVPFPSDAVPAGKSGWKVTFRTPNQQPALATAALSVHVTCAQPA